MPRLTRDRRGDTMVGYGEDRTGPAARPRPGGGHAGRAGVPPVPAVAGPPPGPAASGRRYGGHAGSVRAALPHRSWRRPGRCEAHRRPAGRRHRGRPRRRAGLRPGHDAAGAVPLGRGPRPGRLSSPGRTALPATPPGGRRNRGTPCRRAPASRAEDLRGHTSPAELVARHGVPRFQPDVAGLRARAGRRVGRGHRRYVRRQPRLPPPCWGCGPSRRSSRPTRQAASSIRRAGGCPPAMASRSGAC